MCRCRGAVVQVQRYRGAEVQRCRGAEVKRCRGAEVQRRRGAEVQRCNCKVQVQLVQRTDMMELLRFSGKMCRY
jgi:hypothetical protein